MKYFWQQRNQLITSGVLLGSVDQYVGLPIETNSHPKSIAALYNLRPLGVMSLLEPL